jgi:site-specific DNA recombinase
MTMIAAVYARKSTEQNVSEDARSVTRQVEMARAFAERSDWTTSDEYVYIDDAVSGADFLKRDGLTRLLAAATAKRRVFDVIIAMDESRIGRDQYRTAYVLQQIADAGVQLWYYQEQRQAKLDDATGKFMESVRGFAAEMEREKARARTREPLRRKAAQGYVAGGKVYGYTNVRKGSHTVRVINEAEAAIVRRIFEMRAAGPGLLKIAKTLNAEGVPSPKGDGWSSTAIREMLRRELYRGRVVYGKTAWADKGGTKVKVDVPASEWLVSEQPELRIIPEPLWQATHEMMERKRQTYHGLHTPGGARPGLLNGRPESGLVSRHLLSGFLRCGICGGNMFVAPRTKRGQVWLYYRCSTNWKRGSARCSNNHGVPYNEITQAVIDHFSPRFLTPDVLRRFMEDEQAAATPDAIAAERAGLTADVRRLDTEIQRLVDAVAEGAGSVAPLVDAMKRKQKARDNAAARIVQLDELTVRREQFDLAAHIAAGGQLIVDLEDMLQNDPAEGRRVLRSLLLGIIKVTPKDTASGIVFEYHGECRLDPILAGRIDADGSVTARAEENLLPTVLVPPG